MLENEQQSFRNGDPDERLTIHEARKMLGISESTWRRGVKSGRYPCPQKVSVRGVRWVKSEVELCRDSLPRS